MVLHEWCRFSRNIYHGSGLHEIVKCISIAGHRTDILLAYCGTWPVQKSRNSEVQMTAMNVSTNELASWEVTNCVEDDPHGASQVIPRVSGNPIVHNRVHKSPPLVPLLSHMSPFLALRSYICTVYFNIIFLRILGLPSGLLRSEFPTHAPLLYTPIHATFPVHLILLDFIAQFSARGASLEAHHYLISFTPLSPRLSYPNINLPQHPFLVHPQACVLNEGDPSFSPIYDNQWPNNGVSVYARNGLADVVSVGGGMFRR